MRSISRLVPLAILLAPLAARGSDPSSIYTVPTKVEILPDDATGTRVRISGAFFFLNAAMGFSYDEPRCGYMTFECHANQALCRMQWLDIRKAIGGTWCAGFGTLGMVSRATVHTDWGAAVKPDPWDLGMGVTSGSSVDGKCPKARALNCALAPRADGGAPDVSAPDVAPPAPDVAPSPDLAPQAGPDAPVSVGPPPAADAAAAPQPAKPSGCASGGASAGMLPLLLAAMALLRRTRR